MEALIGVLAGDGIGAEVTAEAVRVLAAVGTQYGHAFTFRHGLIGGAAIDATGSAFPPATRQLCADAAAVLLGAVG
ncbi:MAG: 3-isopropylmalate dehydrogenase, partial [Chromatiales bacterium]